MALDARNDTPILETAFYNALRNWSKSGGSFAGGSTKGSSAPSGVTPTGSGGGAVGISGSAAVTAAFKDVGGAVSGVGKGLFDLTGKFLTGGTKVSDVSKTLGLNLDNAANKGSKLAGMLGAGTDALDTMVKYVEDGIDTFRELSKSGAAFNNDVVGMRVNAANTRMTLGEFGQVVQDGSKYLSGLGGSVTKGAQVFTNFSKAFFDSGAADELRSMGYNTKDINELLLTQITSTKISSKMSADALEKEIKSAQALATEMDAVAKLTGKSRKEQEDELRKKQEDGQVRASIELAVMEGGDGVRKAFNSLSTASALGGKDFQKMQEQVFAMGRPSEEMAEKFALAGGAAQKLMFDAAAAAKKGDEAESRRLTREAAAAYATQQMTKTNLSIASQEVRAAGDGVAASRQLNDALRSVAKENNLNLEDAKDRTKALALADEAIKKEQTARSGTTDTVIQLEGRMADVTAALNNKLIMPLNDLVEPELKKLSTSLRGLNDSVRTGGFRGKSEESIDKVVERIQGGISKVTKREGPATVFSDDQANSLRDSQVSAIKKGLEDVKTGGKKVSTADADSIKTISGALRASEGERVSQAIEKLAKDQQTTSEKLIREAVVKPGGMTELKESLAKIPEIASTIRGVSAANQATDTAGNTRTKVGADKIVSGETAPEVATNAASETLNLLKKGFEAIKEINVNSASLININNKPVGSNAGFANGGVSKGPTSGYYALLHGEETIIPNKDIDAVIGGAISKLPKPTDQMSMSENTDRAYSAMQSMNPARMFAELKAATSGGGVDLKNISKEISTTISSVSGGGSVTKQRVQSDESKAAEQELKSVKEQYAVEREALLQKTKEQLGPDAGLRKIRTTMRDGEEGKALEEKYKSLISPLEKKIEEGIKWEVETKQSAINETKQIVESELSMVKVSNAELNKLHEERNNDRADFADKEIQIDKDSRDEIFKAAEAHRDIIGQSVKDMSDDALAALLPAGSKMEDFYVDMKGNLQSWANDSATKLKDIIKEEKAFNKVQTAVDSINNQTKLNASSTFAAQDNTIPTTNNAAAPAIELPKIDLNALNLPGFGATPSVKAATASMATKTPSPGKKINPETGEEYTPIEELEKQQGKTTSKSTPVASGKASSTLDDVVKGLGMLNSNISRLIEQNAEIGNKQIRAVQANSNNVYEKA